MNRRLVLVYTILCIAVVITACGLKTVGDDGGVPEDGSGEYGAQISQSAESENPKNEVDELPEIEPVRPVTVSFVGDVFCGETVYNKYKAAGLEGIMSEKVIDIFQNSDIMVVNHEYCSTDIGPENKLTYQTWIEQAPVENDMILRELGVDLACIANNHMFDYGEQGFLDTLNTLTDLGIRYVGGGVNKYNAGEAKILKAGNKKIAFFASNQVITDVSWIAGDTKPGMNALYTWSDTYQLMLENIKEAKEKCDLVVVMLHFGNELENNQNETQKQYARALIDAGADVIIGDHAHVLQGAEWYNDGLIFYGMGNFLFTNYTRDTMIVTITIDVDGSFTASILPCLTYDFYVRDADTDNVRNLINQYAINLSVDSQGNVLKP